jgi:hypothetical protein
MNPQTPTPLPGTTTTVTGSRWTNPMPRRLTGLLFVVLVVVIVFSLFAHRTSPNEKLVGRVLESIQRNDMAPVAKDFNAVTRDQFTRASVGRNADLLAPLGALKNVKETTPKDSPPRRHTFTAKFDKGALDVTMVLDSDGKITGFRFVPAPAGGG